MGKNSFLNLIFVKKFKMTKLATGIEHTTNKVVEYADTAAAYGSGLVEVFATPAMIAMMEKTCLQLVQANLDKGYTTVGTAVDIKHIKATLKGERVTCTAKLTETDGAKLVFRVEAFDEVGMIGMGTHKRFIVDNDKFMKSLK
jgi:predicted thioesterase